MSISRSSATLICWLVVFSLWNSNSFAAIVEFSIANADGEVGSTVATPLMGRNAVGIGAIQLNVIYDPDVLEPVAVDAADGVNALVDFNIVASGVLRLAMASTQQVERDGELLRLQWKVLGGEDTKLELGEIRAWEQETSFELPVSSVVGTFVVTSAKVDAMKPTDSDSSAAPIKMPVALLVGIAVGIGIVILLLLLVLLRR